MSWEYRHLDDENPHQFVIKANELGAVGWELSALFLEHGFYTGIFKRPAPFAVNPALEQALTIKPDIDKYVTT